MLAAAIAAMALAGCSGDGPQSPTAGALKLKVSSPYSDDGALLVALGGGQIDSVVAESGLKLYSGRPIPDVIRLVITGPIGSGTVARVYVPDVGKVGTYTVSLDQAASRTTFELRDISGYQVSLVR